MSINVGSAMAYLDLDITGFQKGLGSAMSEMKKFTDDSVSLSQRIKSLGSGIASTGTALTKSWTVPLAGVGIASTKLASDFESSMSKVEAISGSTGQEMSILTDKAIEMGAKTKFSAKESADAFTYMAMAGWDAGQMVDGIAGIMSLAAADGLDLATTSDIVTDALTAFGLQASDSARFADVLAQASSSANTNVSMLGESFKYIGPVAGSLGMSVEDVALALGLMANSGIKSSQAGTSLRSALTNLVKPTDTMIAWMERLNIEVENSDGTMKSLRDIMTILRGSFSSLTEAEQANAAASLFGKEAMSGMLAIINASESDFNKLADAIDNSSGRADEMAETMMDNLGGAIEQLMGALESLAIKVGTALTPVIRDVAEFLTKIVEWMNTLSDEQIRMIVTIGAIVAAIGPVLIILGKVVTAISSIAGAIAGFAGVAAKVVSFGGTVVAGIGKIVGLITGTVIPAIASLGAPILAVIAIVGALVAACVAVYKNWEDLSSFAKDAWNSITDAVGTATQAIGEFFTNMISSIGDFIRNLGSSVSSLFTEVVDKIGSFLSNTMDSIRDGLSNIIGSVTEWGRNFAEQAKGIASSFVENFVSFFSGLPERVMNFIGGLISQITNWGQSIVSIGQTVASSFVGAMTSGLDVIASTFRNIFDNLVQTVSNFKGMMFDAGKQLFTSLFSGMKEVWNTVTSWLSEAFASIRNFMSNISDAVSNVKNKITGFFNGSHANGLDYVPFNGYVAELHQGERVLTKQEAEEYNNGRDRNDQGGNTFNFYNTKPDPYEYARQMKRVMKELQET